MDNTIRRTLQRATNYHAKDPTLLYIVRVRIAIKNLRTLSKCNSISTTTILIVIIVVGRASVDEVLIHQYRVDVRKMMIITLVTETLPRQNLLIRQARMNQKMACVLLECVSITNTKDLCGAIMIHGDSTSCLTTTYEK